MEAREPGALRAYTALGVDAAGKLDTAWIDATLRRIGCNPDPQ